MYRQPADFHPDGYSEIDGCREPGFRERFGRRFHCSFHCLHWKRILGTDGGRSPRVSGKSTPFYTCSLPVLRKDPFSEPPAGGDPGFGKIGPLVSLLVSLLAGKADSRNHQRVAPPGFETIEPRFPVFFPLKNGNRFSEPTLAGEQGSPGACPEPMIGQGGFPRRGCSRNGGGQGSEPRIAPAAMIEPSIDGRQPHPGGLGGGLEGPAPGQLGDHGQGGGSGELRRSTPRIATNGHDRAPELRPQTPQKYGRCAGLVFAPFKNGRRWDQTAPIVPPRESGIKRLYVPIPP